MRQLALLSFSLFLVLLTPLSAAAQTRPAPVAATPVIPTAVDAPGFDFGPASYLPTKPGQHWFVLAGTVSNTTDAAALVSFAEVLERPGLPPIVLDESMALEAGATLPFVTMAPGDAPSVPAADFNVYATAVQAMDDQPFALPALVSDVTVTPSADAPTADVSAAFTNSGDYPHQYGIEVAQVRDGAVVQVVVGTNASFEPGDQKTLTATLEGTTEDTDQFLVWPQVYGKG